MLLSSNERSVHFESKLTLDPDNWEQLRDVAHLAMDEVLNFQKNIDTKPVWQAVPKTTEDLLGGPLPQEGKGAERVIQEMMTHIMPYPAGHAHPRFWGWVCGTGTPVGMIADMLAAGVNASAGVFNDASSRVENQVLSWMRDLFGFPEQASGIITSGGSMANIVGLTVARDSVLQQDVRRLGLQGLPGRPMIYASQQVHSSVDKACMMLGLGRDNLRKVATDDQYRMCPDQLEAKILEDKAAGHLPIAVVANAGTVNTGAIDDIAAIAACCRHHGMWLHVDGAIGALAALSPALRPLFRDLKLADSIAFDFHKWLYVPYEAGCILFRDGEQHRRSFTAAASYLDAPERGIGANIDSSNMRGPQLSRGFKALKVWAQFQTYGASQLGNVMAQNVRHIRKLADLIDAFPDLERLAPVPLNILCFRFVSDNADEALRDRINIEILMRLQEQGIAAPSSTRINGKFALRVANTNHRSRWEDFELLVTETRRLGRELLSEG